jgi:2-dehydropantoate 2-reductase
MKIAIFGAGTTGCYLAGELILAGLNVSLICRERIKDSILKNDGLTLTDYLGLNKKVMPEALITDITPESEYLFDVVFVTLKCHQLTSAAEQLLAITNDKSHIILMQNGIGSIDMLAPLLPERLIFQGITPFNVLSLDNAVFHKGVEGDFYFESTTFTKKIQQAFESNGLTCHLQGKIQELIYGKVLLNLNNALNAVSGLPIKQQLETRENRKQLAAAMREWLAVCDMLGVNLMQFTKVKPQYLPFVLSLPNWLFTRAAKQMLDIDAKARSSMWEDIQAKRKTEIEFINGAVVKLGKTVGVETPVNQMIVAQVHKLESSFIK